MEVSKSASPSTASPLWRKLLLANSAVTPCNKVEWQIATSTNPTSDCDGKACERSTLRSTVGTWWGRPNSGGGAASGRTGDLAGHEAGEAGHAVPPDLHASPSLCPHLRDLPNYLRGALTVLSPWRLCARRCCGGETPVPSSVCTTHRYGCCAAMRCLACLGSRAISIKSMTHCSRICTAWWSCPGLISSKNTSTPRRWMDEASRNWHAQASMTTGSCCGGMLWGRWLLLQWWAVRRSALGPPNSPSCS